MVKLKINNIVCEVKENTTILDACKSLGIEIPTLCYLKDINEIGACRVCVVEIVGKDRLVASCNTLCEENMEILTDSEKAIEARKNNVKLILSQHNDNCTTCVRNKNCKLQSVAKSLNILENEYEKQFVKDNFDKDFPIVRDANKCIKCLRCVNLCEKVQALGVWGVIGTGSYTNVGVKNNALIKASNCSACGQCITHCPVGALYERDDTKKVYNAIKDKEKVTIFQIAPAVRTGYGEEFGLGSDIATANRLVGALKYLGADYVYDTTFTADLTIMEEGSELIERLNEIKKTKMPMFTSCCPAWVRFLKVKYPEFVENLSTAKSPQQMFGALSKTYFAEVLNIDKEKIFSVSIMPCTSKKYEADVETFKTNGLKDVDAVLTTREVSRLIKSCGIDLTKIQEKDFDAPLGVTGAGVIFGATGGVMEAALRSAYKLVTGSNVKDADCFYNVRGEKGYKEASFNIGDNVINVAVVSGLKNAENLIKNIKENKAVYDFVEVMACPTGCSGGGGQPIRDGVELGAKRGEVLYNIDKNSKLRFSHENQEVIKCYENFLEKPLSKKAHELLHTNQKDWNL